MWGQSHAVLLDMDGLLLDTEPIYRRAWQETARRLGAEISDEQYLAFIGRPNVEAEVMLAELLGPAFPMATFKERWPVRWRQLAEDEGVALRPGADDLLTWIDRHRPRHAVVTSSTLDFTTFTLAQAGLARRFETLVTGDLVVRGKPAPDIYFEAQRRIGTPSSNTVALEDSDNGVRAAAAAGIAVIHVPDLKQPSQGARRAASAVVPSLVEAVRLLESWRLRGKLR